MNIPVANQIAPDRGHRAARRAARATRTDGPAGARARRASTRARRASADARRAPADPRACRASARARGRAAGARRADLPGSGARCSTRADGAALPATGRATARRAAAAAARCQDDDLQHRDNPNDVGPARSACRPATPMRSTHRTGKVTSPYRGGSETAWDTKSLGARHARADTSPVPTSPLPGAVTRTRVILSMSSRSS